MSSDEVPAPTIPDASRTGKRPRVIEESRWVKHPSNIPYHGSASSMGHDTSPNHPER